MTARTRQRRPLRLLISAGPTREPLDPVRFLSNYSTGYMGSCLAREALRRGHRATLVSGPSDETPPQGVKTVRVERAREMQEALRQRLPSAEVLIMAAAVCDFEAAAPRREKLPRRGRLQLSLKAAPDIVGSLPRRPGQLRVGFSLETTRPLERARRKLSSKRLDLMVVQRHGGRRAAQGDGSPFGRRAVEAWLLDACGATKRLGLVSKPRLARAILDEIERLWYGGRRSQRDRWRKRARGLR